MSELKKLLEGVKVEWKALSDVAEIGTGSRNTNEAKLDGKYPFFVRSQTPRLIDEYEFNETAIITAGDGVGVGKVFHYIVGKYALHQRAYRIVAKHKSLDSKYLFHYIKNNFAEYIEKVSVHASVTSLRKPMFEKFPIPIPNSENPERSLKIQSEIVRILDALTEETNALTNELNKELQAHQKQYEYQREALFKFEGKEVEWKSLGKVLTIKNGKDYKNFKTGDVPVYGSGGIMTYIDTYIFDNPSVLIPRKGSLKNLFYVEGPFWTVDTIFWTEINAKIMHPKYAFHYLKTQRLEELNMAGGVPSLTQSILNKLPIPVPCPENPEQSLKIQEEIVRVLDDLDAETQAIIAEIKREIALRNKQYEYYRDLLLTFPKEEA